MLMETQARTAELYCGGGAKRRWRAGHVWQAPAAADPPQDCSSAAVQHCSSGMLTLSTMSARSSACIVLRGAQTDNSGAAFVNGRL